MGYTHYFSSKRDLTVAEWSEVSEHIAAILKASRIAIGNGCGDKGSAPEFTADRIAFNGRGANAHETFEIHRKRGEGDFCKTERKPYDLAVTACLCYLSSVTESHYVTSDGYASDFLAGLALARRALPKLANVLDLPMGCMESDRWCMPWVHSSYMKGAFEVHFCVDGKGYVIRKGGESYCFASHVALAQWLDSTKAPADRTRARKLAWGETPAHEPNIWNAYGSFDAARGEWLGKLQKRACAKLFPVPAENAGKPPAYVRPEQMPAESSSAYYFSDLLKAAVEESV